MTAPNTTNTALDTAHAAMMATPDDGAARMQFYQCLADSTLYMLLEKEVEGDNITPQTFDLSQGSCVLVFDAESRLAQFTGTTTPYAALSGRMISALLLNKNISLGVNLDVAPSAILLPPDALAWLSTTLETQPSEHQRIAKNISKPSGLNANLLSSLKQRILSSGGVARAAFLVSATYASGAQGLLLGFVDTPENARDALAKSVSETLIFSGLDGGTIDVGFFAADDPVTIELARHGLQFDLPKPQKPVLHTPIAPGSDPENPPILK